MVGYYYDLSPGSIMHSFLYDGTTFSPIEYPGAISTEVMKIDGSNIIGLLQVWREWRSERGLFSVWWEQLDHSGLPWCSGYMSFGHWRQHNCGRIFWWNQSAQGFIFDGTNWTTLNYPGAYWTDLIGISGGTILGLYPEGGGENTAFIATPVAPVPLPGALLLVGSGLIPFIRLRRKFRTRIV